MTADERCDELETRLAYQDQALSEMSGVIYEQDRRIARLEELLKAVSERLKDLAEEKPNAAMPHERPPHY